MCSSMRTIPTRVGRTKYSAPISAFGAGPSPHAWGERCPSAQCASAVRTIPTRVGRTATATIVQKVATDHPHTRGENLNSISPVDALNGPSPHAWGEPGRRRAASRRWLGPSPHAWGERTPGANSSAANADHPHTRGENDLGLVDKRGDTGPSPHAWGELGNPGQPPTTDRTIPTRVGRTLSRGLARPMWLDHPHTRGENIEQVQNVTPEVGPSPHAWGEHHRLTRRLSTERTIPTRVGRTYPGWDSSAQYTGPSPHAWGEPAQEERAYFQKNGPSPHAWGEHRCRRGEVRRERTIPTRVGRTIRPNAFRRRPRLDHPHTRGENPRPIVELRFNADHPHTRGENITGQSCSWCHAGPSPHAWGERCCKPPGRIAARTIPTRVGRTDSTTILTEGQTDHPHTRGENGAGIFARPFGLRTIPTRVGRTFTQHGVTASFIPDHPHTRGENNHMVHDAYAPTGPSPHAWGEQQNADAGCCECGPSPHAWGEHLARRESPSDSRTIPTRVGRT